ncbi:MAG: hypothetical protein MRY74_01800 [Neomegalonema sp.]|nr:hypothetical protein [Neomegalonema sp.]
MSIQKRAAAFGLVLFAGAAQAQTPDIYVSTFVAPGMNHSRCVTLMREECRLQFGECRESRRGAYNKSGKNTIFMDCVNYDSQVVAVFAGATVDGKRGYDYIRDTVRALNDAVFARREE